jgi:hypothetical protein
MNIKLNPEEEKDLEPVARVETRAFLAAELERVKSNLEHQRDDLERHYPTQEEWPIGDQELMAVYRQKKVVIEGLLEASESALLYDLLRERIEAARQLVGTQGSRSLTRPDGRKSYWAARRELEILTELRGRWMGWLYPKETPTGWAEGSGDRDHV